VRSRKLRDMHGEQAEHGGPSGGGAGLCAVYELVAYKRTSVGTPLVSAPVTSAHSCGGRRLRPGALFEVTGVGSSVRSARRRSIITRGVKKE
jgi:hypothetical protein